MKAITTTPAAPWTGAEQRTRGDVIIEISLSSAFF
jgi:hypothetical protein